MGKASVTERPALYLLEAFGLHDPWVLWRIHNGYLVDDGRLTADVTDEDVADRESAKVGAALGLFDPCDIFRRPVHIDRRGLDTNRRRAHG